MRLVSQTEVMAQATLEARRVVAAAEEEAAQMRQEIDDYVDAKLANFEIILAKTQEAVHKGREKIAGRRAVDDLTPLDSLAHEEDEDDSAPAAPGGGSAPGAVPSP